VALIGNLTRDPELRHTPGGTAVCSLRIAVNDRIKRNDEWVETPYYFDVTVWGRQGENCAQWLAKGKKVGVNGKLTWREWEAQDGTKRQAVEIVAAQFGGIDFLTPKSEGSSGGHYREDYGGSAPADDPPFDAQQQSDPDSDIPF
jgi:single-strand DNA-binding protein